MFCSKCGSNMPDGAPFCGNCGTPFAQPNAQMMGGAVAPIPATGTIMPPLPMDQFMSQQQLIAENKKTQYVINFNADPKDVIAVITSWLVSKGARYMQEDGILYYEMGDAFIGKRSFEYYIQGNQLIILAYLRTPRKPSSLQRGMVGAAATVPYDNSITQLLQSINGLSQSNVVSVQQSVGFASAQSQQLNQGQNYINQTVNSFSEASASRMDKMAIGAFAFSLADLFITLFGFTFGALLLILSYYFGYLGLKSNKKTLAVLSMVITTLALCIFFYSLFKGAPIID